MFDRSKSESLRDVSVARIGDTFPTVFRRLVSLRKKHVFNKVKKSFALPGFLGPEHFTEFSTYSNLRFMALKIFGYCPLQISWKLFTIAGWLFSCNHYARRVKLNNIKHDWDSGLRSSRMFSNNFYRNYVGELRCRNHMEKVRCRNHMEKVRCLQ